MTKAQGAFEYVLLLGGIVLIAVIAILILRSSVLSQTNSQIQNNTVIWGNETCLKTWETDPTHVALNYQFSEGQGAVTYDSLGKSGPGTFGGGGPIWVNGSNCPQGGYCLQFNGTNYVNLGSNNQIVSYTNASNFTVEAWIYGNTGYVSGQLGSSIIGDSNYQVGGFEINMVGLGIFYFSPSNVGTGWGCASSVPYTNNTWAFIVAEYSAAKTTIYLNTVLTATCTNEGLAAAPNPLRLGMSPQGGWQSSFNGTVDDVVIYNRLLQPSEIQADYQCAG